MLIQNFFISEIIFNFAENFKEKNVMNTTEVINKLKSIMPYIKNEFAIKKWGCSARLHN
jgi:hypothetical protein